MFWIDPLYIVFVLLPGAALSGWAAWRTRSAFNRYSKVRSVSGITGAQAAQRLLATAGIPDVRIVPTRGMLSDHYNPVNKTLALSEGVYNSSSIAAIGVACHEAGHAIQHARHYAPLHLRSALVPMAGIGSNFGWIAMAFGAVLNLPYLLYVGVALFALMVLFQIVTLPVEFDASARAKRLAAEHGLVLAQEQEGMNRVLNAAALTYVAAVITSLLTLLYYVWRSGLLGGRD